MNGSKRRDEAVERMRIAGKAPRYGDLILDENAGQSNGRRFGMFVRSYRKPAGRLRPGVWFQVTDGRGDFWIVDPAAARVVDRPGFSLVQIAILLSTVSGAGVQFAAPQIGGRRPDASSKAMFAAEAADLVERGFVRAAGNDREFVIEPSGRAALEAMARVSSGAIAARLIDAVAAAKEGEAG